MSEHGDDRAGGGAAEHHRRDDPQRVGRGERDRALGDEGQPEQPGGLAVLPLGRACTASGGSAVLSAMASGGTMPAAMTVAMITSEPLVCDGQPRGGEEVGRLVDRAAEVEAHHQAEDDPEQDRGRAAQAVQPVAQPGHGRGQRAAEHHDHEAAGDQRGEQRDDHDRLQTAHAGRAASSRLIHSATRPARMPPIRPPMKPAPTVTDDRADDEAGRDARPVGDGVGDVAGQRRDEEGEGGLAEHREDGAEVAEEAERGVPRCSSPTGRSNRELFSTQLERVALALDVRVGVDDLVAAEQEAQRDEQTARRDERDHVADAGEQPAADLRAGARPPPPDAAAGVRRRRCRPRGGRSGRPRRRAPRGSSRRAR